jgi:hypothetical protein
VATPDVGAGEMVCEQSFSVAMTMGHPSRATFWLIRKERRAFDGGPGGCGMVVWRDAWWHV